MILTKSSFSLARLARRRGHALETVSLSLYLFIYLSIYLHLYLYLYLASREFIEFKTKSTVQSDEASHQVAFVSRDPGLSLGSAKLVDKPRFKVPELLCGSLFPRGSRNLLPRRKSRRIKKGATKRRCREEKQHR